MVAVSVRALFAESSVRTVYTKFLKLFIRRAQLPASIIPNFSNGRLHLLCACFIYSKHMYLIHRTSFRHQEKQTKLLACSYWFI